MTDDPFPPGWGVDAVGYSGDLPEEDYAGELCAAADHPHDDPGYDDTEGR